MKEILELLEQNAKLTAAQIATMLNISEEAAAASIQEYEADDTILGYKAVVNWDKTDRNVVTAHIEVKVSPSKGEGFEKVAEHIVHHKEVKSLMLMSGGYDLLVIVEAATLKDVAFFVSDKLSSIESVLSTATHFMLKKYKYEGVEFKDNQKDIRGLVC